MPVVSDSSPLILYAKSGLLNLLLGTFGEVWIPPAVYREIAVVGAGRPGADVVGTAPWVIEMAAPHFLPAEVGTARLGAGEVDAIALAWQLRPDIAVLLDDAGGRRLANRLGLRVFGSAGVLIEAKRLGLLAEVGTALTRLMDAELYLSAADRAEILAAAGEAPTADDGEPSCP